MDQNLLPQVTNRTRIKIYNWWNTGKEIYVLVYGKHQNFQYEGGIYFFNNLMTEDIEQQDSVAASEVPSWTRFSNYQV